MAKTRSSSSSSNQSQPSNQRLLKFSRHPSQHQMTNNKDNNNGMTGKDQLNVKHKLMTTNTSVGHVLAMISMGVCRRITNNELIRQRLIAYICLVMIGGLINDFAPLLPRSFMFKVAKTNPLNQWFVKIGWFWTLVLTSPLIAITSAVLSDDKHKNGDTNSDRKSQPTNSHQLSQRLQQLMPYLVSRQMLRLVINTCVWYLSTNFFLYFEDQTGSCLAVDTTGKFDTKVLCVKNGHKWMPGFDISGHTFLLIFSNLILIEECAVMIGWEPFGHQLFEQNTNNDNKKLIPNREQFRLYTKHSKYVRLLFVLITILSLIWDFMLMQTSLFYHTMFQKLVAAVWAVTAWFFTYRYAYKRLAIDVKSPKLNRNT